MTEKFSYRAKSVRLKTARGRTNSSQRWLQRQLNDPYVQQAQAMGYRSRAAFKLLQIQEKFKLFKRGQRIADLGAAPGGWSQVIIELIKNQKNESNVCLFGIDLLEIKTMPGACFVIGDFLDPQVQSDFASKIVDLVDGVVSDMAASTTGHSNTDHIRTVVLAAEAFDVGKKFLKKGGFFVAKVFQGGADKDLLDNLKANFSEVKHFKPPASRKESPEMYVIAKGFKGNDI
jgi:23S rRNA (uridine2552-2'-O)-methyltransferase